MWKVLLCLIMLVTPVIAEDCTGRVSPDERTRIVVCTDNSHAIMWYDVEDSEWRILLKCGLTLLEAQEVKEHSIWQDTLEDLRVCDELHASTKIPIEVVN